jgi:hypothetical protein
VIDARGSSRDSRTLGAGAAIIALVLALGKGVPAWQRWDEAQRDGALQLAGELEAAEQGAAALAAMRDSATTRVARVDSLTDALVQASSTPEAGAWLASALSRVADSSGIRVASLGIRPDSAARQGYARVAVRVSAMGDVEGLTTFLSRIEGGRPLMAVRDLVVSQPEPGGPDNKAEALRFDVLVEALARVDSTRRK